MAGHPVPDLVVPPDGVALWSIFWKVSAYRVERSRVQPGVIHEWLRMHGKRIATIEVPVIEAMDAQFLATLAEEIGFNEERRKASKGR
ncbi:hypothetical protein [Oceaniglobus trochenteri]|uniref:hypothetical protein n=1 Tax=Oceaniglobus trochenteri TaxID=2763260 RepID=UPI001CFFB76B|nr:hypothetical protein [Oceaniglobus trochenteri]